MITKGNENVEYLIVILENIWFIPFLREALDLCELATGVFPEEDAATGILTAKDKRDQVFVDFSTKGFQETQQWGFLCFIKNQVEIFQVFY